MSRSFRIIRAGGGAIAEACRCRGAICVRVPTGPSPGEGRAMAMSILDSAEVAEFERGFLKGPSLMSTGAPADCPYRLAGIPAPVG